MRGVDKMSFIKKKYLKKTDVKSKIKILQDEKTLQLIKQILYILISRLILSKLSFEIREVIFVLEAITKRIVQYIKKDI